MLRHGDPAFGPKGATMPSSKKRKRARRRRRRRLISVPFFEWDAT